MATLAVFCVRCDLRMAMRDPDARGVVTYRCPCGTTAEWHPKEGVRQRRGVGLEIRLDTPDGLAPVRVPSVN